jgi:hypothetical protein
MLMEDRCLIMRMDNRTEEEFSEDISQFSLKEFYWGIGFRYDLCERGMPCQVLEHGVDNTGKLIRGRLPNHNADKRYVFTNGMKTMDVEIKTIPEECTGFFTFKVSAIKGCYRHKAKILVPMMEDYHLLGNKAFFWLLENCEVRTDYKGWGGKACVRVNAWQMRCLVREGLVSYKKWMPKAKSFVNSIKHILLEERRSGAGAR